MPRTVSPEALRCSFSAKSQFDVVKLVAGPGLFICNECIEICNQIITEEMALKGSSTDDPAVRSDSTQDPPTLKAWDGLSDEDLLAEMVQAHAAHQNVDRAVAHHVTALAASLGSIGEALDVRVASLVWWRVGGVVSWWQQLVGVVGWWLA